jgi:TPR repeat protein
MLLGLPEAQYRVGRRYFIGHGITQSYPKAAEQVDAEARARIKALVNEQGNRQ